MKKKALVTGGASGLGQAFCAALRTSGHALVIADRQVPTRDAETLHLACDLADTDGLAALAAKIIAQGPYDMVILNAGISATGPFEAIDPGAHGRVLAVNALAPIMLANALVAAGAIRRGGSLIFIASLSHFTGYPGAASYGASKSAVAIYARSVRRPFRTAHGIRVACAFPGPLKTDHAARHAPKGAKAANRMEPETAARVILAEAARGRAQIVPGLANKLFAFAGQIAPCAITAAMKAIIYDKLEKPVW